MQERSFTVNEHELLLETIQQIIWAWDDKGRRV